MRTEALLRFRQAGESSGASLKAALVIRVARAHATPRCCTYTGLPAAPHRTHLPRRQTYEHLPPSLTLLLLPSHQSLHQTFTLNPSRKHPLPHAHYPPVHPSSSSVPACPCPTHRPVTRPPPDSPRPRYPYNPSRASAPSVNHLPFLSDPQRHCASFTAAVHFLSIIPSIEPSINVSGSTAAATSHRDISPPYSKR
jgi:hypothetical protein